MTDMPETIWGWFDVCEDGSTYAVAVECHEYPEGTKYHRADLPPTPEQIIADPRVKALVDLLNEACGDISTYVDQDYPPDTCAQYPDIARRRHRDLELCRRINEALSALEPK